MNITPDTTIVVNFSGGKDSCAMLHHIMETYPNNKVHVVMADTGWEHKDAIDWSKSITNRYGLPLHVVRNPNKTLLSMVERRGMWPGMGPRQCTSDLKRGPIHTWIRRNCTGHIVSVEGLRAEESPKRAQKPTWEKLDDLSKRGREVWKYLPIQWWKEVFVRFYLEANSIPLHPVYAYLNRFSCRICIYHSKHDTRKVYEHDREAFELVAALEKKIGHTIFMDGPIEARLTAENTKVDTYKKKG